jgi:hypothetical protein
MPTAPARPARAGEPELDATAVFASAALDSAEGSYSDRYAEDSFDYPEHTSPPPAQSWSAGEQPPGFASAAPTEESDSADEGQRGGNRARSRTAGRWQQMAARRRPALMAAAALVVMGGFGVALSMVSDTVSSDSVLSGSGGTAQVSAPKSPIEPALPLDATASAAPPAAGGTGGDGASAAPTATSLLPGTGHQRDDEHGEDAEEDRGREDGEHVDDG